tara:strand:- start:2845 stop:3393 length:549 start_codon:yes stop_codon:yes gene_type:complete
MTDESRQVRRARERAEAKANRKEASLIKNADKCTLLGIATYNGKTLFTGCGEVLIPNTPGIEFGQSKWEKMRETALTMVCNDTENMKDVKKDYGLILRTIGVYLEYSPTLWSEREHPGLIISGMCARTGHEHKVNLQDLGCVFEYELNGNPTTLGPKWMASADVLKEAKARGLKVPQKRKAA